MREFYRYEGSLTHPPCTEGLQWTVIKGPRPISEKQVETFRKIQKEDPMYGPDGFNVRAP